MVVDKFGRGVVGGIAKRKLPFSEASRTFHDLQNKRLAQVGSPEEDNDAVTKSYLDSLIESYPTKDDLNQVKNDLQKIQFFFDIPNRRIIRLNEPTASFHAVTKAYSDNKDKVTKEQIRAECEKVKSEALSESDQKRAIIRRELSSEINSVQQQLLKIKNQIEAIEANRKVDNLFMDAVYRHLGLTKSQVNVNVRETASNQ